jgi:hypothetical protein
MGSRMRALATGFGVALVAVAFAACGSSSPGASGVAIQSPGWPEQWADRVPAPDGCTAGLEGVAANTSTYLNIMCTFEDDDPANHQAVLKGYETKLVDAGFTLLTESSDGAETPDGIGMFQVRKESLNVTILVKGTEGFTINVMTW